MLSRLKFLVKYFLFFFVYFQIIRFLFLIFHLDKSKNLSFGEWFQVFSHGWLLDVSLIGYLMVVVLLFMFLCAYLPPLFFRRITKGFTIFILAIFSFLVFIDLELYTHWAFRLDATPLLYINTPGEMLASSPIGIIIRQICIGILLFFFTFWLYLKYVHKNTKDIKQGNWKTMLASLPLIALMFIPIRGGFDLSPVNISSAYFSKNVFANHAAINLIWNVLYSITEYSGKPNATPFMKEKEADALFKNLKRKTDGQVEILKKQKNNVIVIVLESFMHQFLTDSTNGKLAAPKLSARRKEGIYFSNFYATADRSDKGLAAIFSAFPTLPSESIMKFSGKTQKLPFISKSLKKAGYNSTFIYGGDLNFANMRSYFTNGQFDKIISDKDFPSDENTTKWGIHDEFTFQRLLEECNKAKQPFFQSIFTISSHEPFNVPRKPVFKGEDDNIKYLNSVFYTDSCLYIFIENAKKQEWWKNTLIIILADHGNSRPKNFANHEKEKFHIPMLWLGGALNKVDTTISTIAFQPDMAVSLLSLMNLDSNDYIFGKNLFVPYQKSYAYYAFVNGLGFVTDSTYQVWDISGKTKLENRAKSEYDLHQSKALMQCILKYYLSL